MVMWKVKKRIGKYRRMPEWNRERERVEMEGNKKLMEIESQSELEEWMRVSENERKGKQVMERNYIELIYCVCCCYNCCRYKSGIL